MEERWQMTKLRTCAAIAALMIATPAMACTDWKAIAMFDQSELYAVIAKWNKGQAPGEALDVAIDVVANDRNAALHDPCNRGGQP
jgi:hypothetical protein